MNFWVNWIDKRDNVGMIEPATVLLMSCEDQETVKEMMSPLNLQDKDFILLPVNDIQGKLGSGTHWTLILYVKSEHKFIFFDSASSSSSMFENIDKIKTNLLALLEREETKTIEGSCTKQSNSYDCGVHVMKNMEEILSLIDN